MEKHENPWNEHRARNDFSLWAVLLKGTPTNFFQKMMECVRTDNSQTQAANCIRHGGLPC